MFLVRVACGADKIYSQAVAIGMRSNVIGDIHFRNNYGNGAGNVSTLMRNVGMRSMVTELRNVGYNFGNASYPSRLTGTLGDLWWGK